jgi:hypothetical protein
MHEPARFGMRFQKRFHLLLPTRRQPPTSPASTARPSRALPERLCFVDNTGHLGTAKSSARYKQEIKPMDQASESILKLEPVTFRYKEELDPGGVLQFGLIAEQVENVDPRLVIRDQDGKVMRSLRSGNAMLLNEFLKEHAKVQALERELARVEAQQGRDVADLTAQLNE